MRTAELTEPGIPQPLWPSTRNKATRKKEEIEGNGANSFSVFGRGPPDKCVNTENEIYWLAFSCFQNDAKIQTQKKKTKLSKRT